MKVAENRRYVPWDINVSLFDCSRPSSHSSAEQLLANDAATLSIECDIEVNLPDTGDFADRRGRATQWETLGWWNALLPRAVEDPAVDRAHGSHVVRPALLCC